MIGIISKDEKIIFFQTITQFSFLQIKQLILNYNKNEWISRNNI